MASDLRPFDGRAFAAVLFDLDGTLVDSTPAVERSWLLWAGEYGVDPLALQHFHGVPARGVIAHLLPEEVRAEAERRITDLEVNDLEGLALLPGAADALAALAASGRSAIATSGTWDLADARLTATGMIRPRVVVTASDVEHGKPAPDPYLLAAQRLGYDPAECLVVEDAPAGFASAKAAGCATLAVTTTTHHERLVEDVNVDVVVATLADVRFVVDHCGVTVHSV